MDSVIFDLDGTLWDTCKSCAMAWNNVVHRNNIEYREITAEDIASVTGKSHRECVENVYIGLAEKQIDLITEETQIEDNVMVAKHGGYIYEGVESGLKELAQKFQLYIVSNCQAGYIETFLKWSAFTPLFKDFECWGNTGLSKSANLASVIERNNLKSTVYIGDTTGDLKAAKDCSVPFVQVTYGFGSPIFGEKQVSKFPELVKLLMT